RPSRSSTTPTPTPATRTTWPPTPDGDGRGRPGKGLPQPRILSLCVLCSRCTNRLHNHLRGSAQPPHTVRYAPIFGADSAPQRGSGHFRVHNCTTPQPVTPCY